MDNACAISSRWPGKRAFAKKMYMQMRNTFTRIWPAINDDTIAVRQLEFLRQITRNQKQFAEQRAIFILRICEVRNHSLGHDQHVHGCLWINVVKRDCIIVFPDNFRWNLARDDFFENGHGVNWLATWRFRVNVRILAVIQLRNGMIARSEEHTSELQSPDHLVCRLLLEKK